MKPILKYPGGKSNELNIILQEIPEFKGNYIEPFIGGGALFFNLNKKSIINDVNSNLIKFYRELNRDIKDKIDLLVDLFNNNSEEENKKLYYKIRDYYNKKDYSEFSFCEIYYFINKTVFSGLIRTNKKGEFNGSFGYYKKISNSITDEHLKLLSNTEIYNKDFSEIFKLSKEDDFIFLDPPYDSTYTNYGNGDDSFSREKHLELFECFKNTKAKALMIINSTDFIEDLYKDYIINKYNKKYLFNIKESKNKNNHLIIRNY